VDDRRLEIDRRIIQNHGTYVQIAEEFGFSSNQVRNHAIHHLSRQLSVTYGRKELIQNLEIAEELKQVLENAKSIFQRNYEERKDHLALKSLDSILKGLELIARIAAFLHEAKVMEQRAKQEENETRVDQEHAEFMNRALSRLNYAELTMLQKLLDKAEGRTDARIEDVTLPPDLESAIVRAVDSVRDDRGFEVETHRFDLVGTCSDCR
jgi:transposase-like protein